MIMAGRAARAMPDQRFENKPDSMPPPGSVEIEIVGIGVPLTVESVPGVVSPGPEGPSAAGVKVGWGVGATPDMSRVRSV